MISFRLRKRVRFVMPGRPLSEMEKTQDERTHETDDDHLRGRLIPDSDNRSEPQRQNYHSIN